MGDRLRPVWDFDDLDATERRFRELLEREASDTGRAEVLTQLARVEGLRGRFGEGERLLREAEEAAGTQNPTVRARVSLERGRLLRSSGDSVAAFPLFEASYEAALEAGDDFIAADAAHMAALAAGDREGMLDWTRRGVELAESSEHAAYWLGPLLNNLGWAQYEAGEHASALASFRRALEARQRNPEHAYEIEVAGYAVGKALRALGRAAEAVPLLEQAVAWAEAHGAADSWFREELAEEYAALGRGADAQEQARRALALIEPDDERAARLRELAGYSSSASPSRTA